MAACILSEGRWRWQHTIWRLQRRCQAGPPAWRLRLRIDLGGPGREFDICDLVVQSAPTSEEALLRCADDVLAVTYPPVEALCTGKAPKGPGARNGEIETSLSNGEIVRWIVFVGPAGVHEEAGTNGSRERALAEFEQRPAVVAVLELLTKRLLAPQLHWCRIAGRALDRAFFCAFDNADATDLVAELSTKFRTGVEGDWRFRQFAVFVPLTRPSQRA